jgi:L-arabinose transport system substrate-binding protein
MKSGGRTGRFRFPPADIARKEEKVKERIARIVGMLALTLFASSLSFAAGTQESQGAEKIGFLVKMPEQTWFQLEWRFAEEAGKEFGFEVIKIGTQDGEKVLAAIDNLAAQKAKGFVICTPDTKLGPAIMAKANSYKMKVIAVDDRFVKADGSPMTEVAYLGISATKIGETVGATLWKEFKARGWKVEETGLLAITANELQTARERVDGAESVLIANGFPKERIFEAPQRTTDIEGGFNAASPVITNNPQIKNWLVCALNDDSVVGGVRALEGRGFAADRIIGVGINGDTTAINEFKKTTPTGFHATVLLAAREHGYETAKMLYTWIKDGTQPPLDTRTSGTLIDRSNYRDVLTKSGLEALLN